ASGARVARGDGDRVGCGGDVAHGGSGAGRVVRRDRVGNVAGSLWESSGDGGIECVVAALIDVRGRGLVEGHRSASWRRVGDGAVVARNAQRLGAVQLDVGPIVGVAAAQVAGARGL